MPRLLRTAIAALVVAGAPLPSRAQDATRAQARAALAAGDTARAIALYQSLTTAGNASPADRGTLVDLFEATGQWHSALSDLQLLLSQDSTQPAHRYYQAGRFLAWSGRHEAALSFLEQAVARAPDSTAFRLTLAEVETWHVRTRPRGITRARAVLTTGRDSVGAIRVLAPALSWNGGSRDEARQLFEAGLRLAPNDPALRTGYADLLSWSPETRDRAAAEYDAVLTAAPDDIRAAVGRANIALWRGALREAERRYRSVLAGDSANADARVGLASVLNRWGRHREALAVLTGLTREEASTPPAAWERVDAEAHLRHYAAAQELLARTDRRDLTANALRDTVAAALRPTVELHVDGSSSPTQVDAMRVELRSSVAVAPGLRLGAWTRTTAYREAGTGSARQAGGLSLQLAPNEVVSLDVDLGARELLGMEGSAMATLAVRPGARLHFGATRQGIEEMPWSVARHDAAGDRVGPARADRASAALELTNRRLGFDAVARYTRGVAGGNGLARNQHWSADGQLGYALRRLSPFVRIAYGFVAQHYAYDASGAPGAIRADSAGGYFSPDAYRLHYGQLTAQGALAPRLGWTLEALGGRQWVAIRPGAPWDARRALAGGGRLEWFVTEGTTLSLALRYQDVAGAYERREVTVGWRRAF
jgi:tetratricopeptide (TPR) repeat protein